MGRELNAGPVLPCPCRRGPRGLRIRAASAWDAAAGKYAVGLAPLAEPDEAIKAQIREVLANVDVDIEAPA